jgi:hypothetical protein
VEVQGTDGILKLTDNFLSITWISLKGRLNASTGADFEVVPLERIFDHSLLEPTPTQLGCLQIRLLSAYGKLEPLNRESKISDPYSDRSILHSITFHQFKLPHFINLHKELEKRVAKAKSRVLDQFLGLDEGAANS